MFRLLDKIRFRSQLLLYFMIMSISPMIILALIMYNTVKNDIVRLLEENMMENAEKSSDLLSHRFDNFETLSLYLNVNDDLYNIFLSLGTSPNDLQILQADRKLQKILSDYFINEDYYSVHLVTSYYRFGTPDKNNYSPEKFFRSDLYQISQNDASFINWVPTYDYCEMFEINNIPSSSLEYGSLFSIVSQLHLSTAQNGRIKRIPESLNAPILTINFTPDSFSDLFSEQDTNTSEISIITKEGSIVFQSSPENEYDTAWISLLPQNSTSGYLVTDICGVETLIGYAINPLTDWILVNSMPMATFTRNITQTYLLFVILFTIILFLLSTVLSFLLSLKINNKILLTLKTIEKMGAGDFSSPVIYDQENEFAFFYDKINTTNHDIQSLIYENYAIKLRQKETEILLLNIQLNPHFLYNTLNIINWLCINNETQSASDMIVELSRMLQYTSNSTSEQSLLKEDIIWIKDYLDIMRIRFENEFDVSICIPNELDEIYVPKLFLQPLVENCIVHGFKDIDYHGNIEISAQICANTIIFYVTDNGSGMTETEIHRALSETTNSIGIKNTNRRIQLLYGEKYGIKIESVPFKKTTVYITLPNELYNL